MTYSISFLIQVVNVSKNFVLFKINVDVNLTFVFNKTVVETYQFFVVLKIDIC